MLLAKIAMPEGLRILDCIAMLLAKILFGPEFSYFIKVGRKIPPPVFTGISWHGK